MTTIRVQKSAAAALSHTFYVGEDPTDPTSPTVLITDAAGATVSSGSATAGGSGTGTVTYTLPAQSQLARLTVAWTGTVAGLGTVTETDTVEVVGGFLFGLAEARASDPALQDANKYTTADLIDKRQAVEEEVEWICDRAFTPHYARVVMDGSGTTDLVLPGGGSELVAGVLLQGVRTVRSATTAPRIGGTFTALTVTQLAALAITRDGVLRRTDGNVWPEGLSNVVLEYEYGADAPPADLKTAALLRLKSRLNLTRTGIPDRAVSYSSADGGTYRLSLPDAYKTGIPDVDGPYARYSRRVRGGTAGASTSVPASQTLTYDTQRHSLFHGH